MRRLAGIPSTVPIPSGPSSYREIRPDASEPVASDEIKAETALSPTRLLLSQDQTQRILTISHLENGKDPMQVVSELLDSDAKRRREFPHLSFANESEAITFLTLSRLHGWNNPEKFLDFLAQTLNLGLSQLSPTTARAFILLAKELDARKWDIAQFVDEATRSTPSSTGIPNTEEVASLLKLLSET